MIYTKQSQYHTCQSKQMIIKTKCMTEVLDVRDYIQPKS
jgi:hypothetical protein